MREQLAQYAGWLERQQRDPIDFGQIVGGGQASERVLQLVEEVAATDTPVLIEGEAGLEKDVVARAIHVGSPREQRPFVSVTSAAFPGEALERELFGYLEGAFEGAFQERAGRFELAEGGTLWLHEPSTLSRAVQARLLRLLVDGEVERIGDTRPRRVDVRLLLSVSPSLGEVFSEHELLPELRSRLVVFPIVLRPLRERRDDIVPLAVHFLGKYAQRNARAATEMSAEAVVRLEAYDWPGNVRELENVVERAAILARGDVIEARHLLFQEQVTAERPRAESVAAAGVTLSSRLDAIERRELVAALDKFSGNKAEVARALGIHRTTLYYRLKKLGIDA
jgi:DNA-binding NtrC family response regulator